MKPASKTRPTEPPRTLENERGRLIRAGIPEFVIDHAFSLRPSRLHYVAGSFGVVGIMLSGFAVGAALWGSLEEIHIQNALDSALELSGVLYWSNFGISALIAIFGWIFASGLILYWVFNLSARMRASVFVYSFVDSSNAAYAKMFMPRESLSQIADPDEYIRSMIGHWSRISFWSAAFLLSIAAYSLERELKSFSVYSAEGYYEFPYFPWETTKVGLWAEAARVEIGCNHVTGKNADDYIVYEITLNSGGSIRLDNTAPVRGTWLDQIEVIDAAVEKSGAQFERWSWMKRDPLHPACVAAQAQKFGAENEERVARILRLGEI